MSEPLSLVGFVGGASRHPGVVVTVALSVAVVVRLMLPGRRWARASAQVVGGLGLLVFALRAGQAAFASGDSGWDFEIFYRAGREANAGHDPYVHPGRDAFLNPLPALSLFRALACLPYPTARAGWVLISAVLAVCLVPLADRVLARGVEGDDESPPPLPGDVAVLLGAALVNTTGSTLGLLAGQLGILTAFALLLSVGARQKGRPAVAGVWLAVAGFKPATMIPFLTLFVRKRDRNAWLALTAVTLGLGLAGGPPAVWKERLEHNLRQIRALELPGGVNNYELTSGTSGDMIAFNHLFHRLGLRDRGFTSAAHGVAVVATLAFLVAAGRSRPFPVAAALASCGSMLFLYHRLYDTVVLALPLAVGASFALTSTGRRRAVAVACVALLLAAANQPRELMIDLTHWSIGRGAVGRVVQAAVLPYATWSILLALPGLLWCSTRPAPRVLGLPRAARAAAGSLPSRWTTESR